MQNEITLQQQLHSPMEHRGFSKPLKLNRVADPKNIVTVHRSAMLAASSVFQQKN